MLEYFAVAQNESIGRVRYEFLQKMLLPCGESVPSVHLHRIGNM